MVALFSIWHVSARQQASAGVWGQPTAGMIVGEGALTPTPVRATSTVPLGIPRMAPSTPGAYRYLGLQAGSDTPIAYDPCRPIRYVVNDRTAPPGTETLVRDAVEDMAEVTGLQFEYAGTTDERVTGDQRAPFQRERYGDRWAPVLITWSDPSEIPGMAGTVAGIGGSTPALSERGGPAVYVTGIVALDGPQIGEFFRASHLGRLLARAVILHELGHLVGLDHVEDRGQLMHHSSGTVDLRSGDLAGLAQLGAGPCVEFL